MLTLLNKQKRTALLLGLFSLLRLTAQAQSRTEDVTFTSEALGHEAAFSVVIPAAPPPAAGYPVLMILHGLGRNHHTLLDNPETLALLKAQPYLIVLPDSAAGWWIDSPVSGTKYSSMLLEVIAETHKRYPVSASSAGWGIIGWSMGGYGAMRFSEDHPDKVSFIGTIIGLLDFPRVEGLPEGQRFGVDPKIFGRDPAVWLALNPSHNLAPLEGKQLDIVIADQAFDRTMNENFVHVAQAGGLKPEVFHIQGEHLFPSVLRGLQILLPLAAKHLWVSVGL